MKKIIGAIISVAILIFLISLANPIETGKIILKANPIWVLAGVFLWGLSVLTRTLRWNFLLEKLRMKVKLIEALKIYVLGMAFSNLTPARAGDPVRSIILKKKYGFRFSKSFTAVIMEKLSDAFSLIPLSIIAFFNPGIPLLNKWMVGASLSFFIVASLAIVIVSSKERVRKMTSGVLWLFNFSKFIKSRKERIHLKMRVFSKTFKEYKSGSWSGAIAWSFFIWMIDGAFYWVAFKSIGLEIPFMLTVIATPVIVFIGVISMLPGSLGSSEAASVFIFTTLAGISIPEATAATLISRILSWWMYMIGATIVLLGTKKAKALLDLAKTTAKIKR